MDGSIAPSGAAEDIVGIGDVATDHLDPQSRQWIGVGAGTGESPDRVAALDQELAHVRPRQPGGAGDEHCPAHAGACSGTSANAVSI